jgi:uncharacterized membrane protein
MGLMHLDVGKALGLYVGCRMDRPVRNRYRAAGHSTERHIMGNLPLHPLVVHVPLVLAMLVPVVVVAILIGDRRRRFGRASWWTAVAVSGLLVVGSLASLNTGSREEERVEAIVAESAIELHEERAETFTWIAGATFVLLFTVPLFRSPETRSWFGTAGLLASLVVAALAIRVGHSGGSLVYVHNAGAAYLIDAGSAGTLRTTEQPNDARSPADHHGEDD